jgi:hypothetical protein
MAQLSTSELFKYDWRVKVFLRMYKAKETFKLTDGRNVVFVPNKAIIKAVNDKDARTINSIGLLTEKGDQIAFGKIEKTKEFGGKGAGFGTTKEDIELTSLQTQIDKLKKENASATIPVKVGNKVYKVAGAASTYGTPKSDFHLLDNDGNEIVWISHKDGRTAKDFQQWGGMTEVGIKDHREVSKFAKDVFNMFDGAIPRATTVARKIKDTKLKNLSVYGVKFGQSLGRQNVSILIQGPVKLVKKGSSYVFESNHIHYNGDRITGDFEPVLMAIYKGDRNNFNVRGARFAIQPLASRKITQMI